jgi:hypothetical protein
MSIQLCIGRKSNVYLDGGKKLLNKEKHGFLLSDIVDAFDDPHLLGRMSSLNWAHRRYAATGLSAPIPQPPAGVCGISASIPCAFWLS